MTLFSGFLCAYLCAFFGPEIHGNFAISECNARAATSVYARAVSQHFLRCTLVDHIADSERLPGLPERMEMHHSAEIIRARLTHSRLLPLAPTTRAREALRACIPNLSNRQKDRQTFPITTALIVL
jgi:hypothetical protein